jgi:glutaredoxin-like protein
MTHIQEKDKEYLREEFSRMKQNVKLVCFTRKDSCQYCKMTCEILQELQELSEKISLEIYDFDQDKARVESYKIDKVPAVVIEGDKDYGIRYFGIPAGHEFGSVIENIMDLSHKKTSLNEETKQALKKLGKPLHIQVFVTPACPYCPRAVRLAHQMAIESDQVRSDMVEATEFPQLSNHYEVSAVPKIIINDVVHFEGSLPERDYLKKVLEALEK